MLRMVDTRLRLRRLDAQAFHLRFLRQLHLVRQSKNLEQRNHHPRHVKLPPLQAVTSAKFERVVVVVPAFTVRQDTYEQVITG